MASPPKLSPIRLPGARELFGRKAELAELDAAWANPKIGVMTIVAWGGVGKTALVSHWRTRLLEQRSEKIDAVFEWSFFSQGSQDRNAVSAESFVHAALVFFDEHELANSPEPQRVKAARLLARLGEQRVLLILDGLEPLQFPPSSAGLGALKEDGVVELLRGLARRNPGLCVVTTREQVLELVEFEGGSAPRRELSQLDPQAGAELLRCLLEDDAAGVTPVPSSVDERVEISEAMGGHALSLLLLGSYIRRALRDVRRWREIQLKQADARVKRGHVWAVMDAYVRWFSGGAMPRPTGWGARLLARAGGSRPVSEGQMQLSVLRLLGLFNQPADPGASRRCVGGRRSLG